MPQEDANPRVTIPSVDRMLRSPDLSGALEAHGRPAVTDAVRTVFSSLRRTIAADPKAASAETGDAAIAQRVIAVLEALSKPSLVPVFNLTGTVLHTNLGRAPLPAAAIEAMVQAASACNLEYDLETGKRGDRDSHLEPLLKRLTGAEAATVVNNNAAAVLLVLNTLAQGREVLVSRGELIEIGGAFRIPDIMARAGCTLREVGTTNRTHLSDFADNIGENTALIMKVHASNYAIEGFTTAPEEAELAVLAHENGVPFVNDLGSGALADLSNYGLPHEPMPAEVLADGADLVTFSGDKLLGGPQAGLIVGQADLIAKVRKNPMKRAMRLDKVTIAALEATLQLYTDPARLAERLPTIGLLSRPTADIAAVAERMCPVVATKLEAVATVEIITCRSQIGSGSLPVDRLDSAALSIRPRQQGRGEGRILTQITEAFRNLPSPVIGRVQDGALVFDLRCLADEAAFASQLNQLDLR
ncbi:MAG: L-seryl-tRNA(Sec) selenium transferase [Alphaproteobacteria bacterium]|nr:L-seryl-tRNA(Sec) selenium transferase [Alphaproteobacteria bacterium]